MPTRAEVRRHIHHRNLARKVRFNAPPTEQELIMPKASAAPTRTLERVPIDKIVTGLNVRTDATPDPELVASVKENGILQPPTLARLGDGNYEVVIGYRRTAAAALAELPDIEAIVIDQELAAPTRLVHQLIENDRRQQLSEAERTGGYKQLELFSVSPAQIAKRLGVKRDRVDVALKVAGNESATKVLDHGIPLDLAAEIIEFEGDKKALTELEKVAVDNPGSFAHVAHRLRNERAQAAKKAELNDELEATGIQRIKDTNSYMSTPGFTKISRFGKPDDPTIALEFADIEDKSILAGRIFSYYGGDPKIEYFIRDDAEHTIPKRVYPDREFEPRVLTPEQQALADERAEADRIERERQQKRADATTVRMAWLAELLQRTKLPDYNPLLAWTMTETAVGFYDAEVDPQMLHLLGWNTPEGVDRDEAGAILRQRLNESAKNADRIILATLLLEIETAIGSTWRKPENLDANYLASLSQWGYGLSDIEQQLMDEGSRITPEPSDPEETDNSMDDDDFDDQD